MTSNGSQSRSWEARSALLNHSSASLTVVGVRRVSPPLTTSSLHSLSLWLQLYYRAVPQPSLVISIAVSSLQLAWRQPWMGPARGGRLESRRRQPLPSTLPPIVLVGPRHRQFA